MNDAFLVVQCPRCGSARVAEARHATARCTRCHASIPLATCRRLGGGKTAAAARHLLTASSGTPRPSNEPTPPPGRGAWTAAPRPRLERHDSPVAAAAAKASAITNLSSRAEAAAYWLWRLEGRVRHDALLEALEQAAVSSARAQAEVVRMLATDVLFEPRPGEYQFLQP